MGAAPFPLRTIDTPEAGVNCSLALDAAQLPRISCWQNPETPDARLLLVTGGGNPFGPGQVTFAQEVISARRGIGSALAIQRVTRPGLAGPSVASIPWVAYYDLEGQSVNVAHREDTGWVIEQVESGVDNFASSNISIAIGSDGKPRVCYSTGQGLTFATRFETTLRVSGAGNEPHCWARDTLAGLHWQRPVIDGGRLTLGYAAGVTPPPPGGASPSAPVMDLSQQPDSLKLLYRPVSASSFGAVFITFGKDIPVLATRRQTELADVTAYASLIVEMRGDADKQVQVGITDRTQEDNGQEIKVSLALNADWTSYTIPLSKFTNVDLKQVYFAAEFVFGGAEPVTMFVRSVKFSDTAVADTVINRVEPSNPGTPNLREFLKGAGPVAGFDSAIGTTPPLAGAAARFTARDDNSSSLRIDFPAGRTSAFVDVHPQTAPSVDVSHFQALLVEMRGDAPLGTVRVGIKDVSRVDRDDVVRVPVTLTQDWRTYAFPLSLFRQAPGVPDLSRIFVTAEFVNKTNAAFRAFVRSVRYSSEPATTVASPGGAAILGGSVAAHGSLALDAAGVPYIAYFDLAAGKLHVAWRAQQFVAAVDGSLQRVSRWVVVAVPELPGDGFAGEFTSIQVDDQGTVHLAWWTLNGPRYARLRGHAPVLVERIESTTGAGMYISLDIRAAGDVREPHVAYYDPGSGGRMKVARRRNGQWSPPEVPDTSGNVGGFASLRLDLAGRPMVAYFDFDRRNMRLAALAP
jgi:hypothetical protein